MAQRQHRDVLAGRMTAWTVLSSRQAARRSGDLVCDASCNAEYTTSRRLRKRCNTAVTHLRVVAVAQQVCQQRQRQLGCTQQAFQRHGRRVRRGQQRAVARVLVVLACGWGCGSGCGVGVSVGVGVALVMAAG